MSDLLRLWKCTAVWLAVNLAVVGVLLVFVTLWWIALTALVLVCLVVCTWRYLWS